MKGIELVSIFFSLCDSKLFLSLDKCRVYWSQNTLYNILLSYHIGENNKPACTLLRWTCLELEDCILGPWMRGVLSMFANWFGSCEIDLVNVARSVSTGNIPYLTIDDFANWHPMQIHVVSTQQRPYAPKCFGFRCGLHTYGGWILSRVGHDNRQMIHM